MKIAGLALTQIFLFCSIVGHAEDLRQHRITDIHTEHRLDKDVLAAVEWDITVDVRAEVDVAYDSCSRPLKSAIIKAIAEQIARLGSVKQIELPVTAKCHIGEVKITANPSVCYYKEGSVPVCKQIEANAQ